MINKIRQESDHEQENDSCEKNANKKENLKAWTEKPFIRSRLVAKNQHKETQRQNHRVQPQRDPGHRHEPGQARRRENRNCQKGQSEDQIANDASEKEVAFEKCASERNEIDPFLMQLRHLGISTGHRKSPKRVGRVDKAIGESGVESPRAGRRYHLQAVPRGTPAALALPDSR